MGLILDEEILNSMKEHATETFPDECCGFMFGNIKDGNVFIENTNIVENLHPDHKARRFLITPDDYMKAEKYADDNNLTLVGVYHSHPNHPAIPSETDRQAALPGFSYIIFSVLDEVVADVTAWELADDRSKFHAVDIEQGKE